jgi:endonuclease/exonuclease/phosphatase family metal-dependent hydrolase
MALLLAGALCYPAAATPPPRALRVVTLNVLHGGPLSGRWNDGDRLEERVDLIAAGLRGLDPDLVGLQEASVGRGRGDVAARLATALGFAHVFAPVRYGGSAWLGQALSALAGFDEGPALLSRFPVADWRADAVGPCDEAWARMLLCADVETPWGRLDACSTHIAGDLCQAESLRNLLAPRQADVPLLLAGDLNAIDTSPALQLLVRDVGLIDTFRSANPTEPGFTVWQPVRAASRLARRRVDYVLFRPADGTGGRVVASRVVLDTPRREPDGTVLWPSDHYGVLTEIEIFPPP